ncbi:MAG: GNAT family N-acetyltransferase [Solirubrobacteraceae bacterium]
MLSHRIDGERDLRLLEERDAAELQAVIESNRAHLAAWMPWAAEQTLDGTLDYIRRSRRELGERRALELAIVQRGAIIGGAGLNRVDWVNLGANIGYWIAERAQGRGTVTMAVRALVDHALGAWDLHRVEIRAGVENARSRAVPVRLGFVQEGVLRGIERFGDRYLDHAVYGMLADDWPSARG